MKVEHSPYDHTLSLDRINNILNVSDNDYSDKQYVPKRENLTYTNGYYVDVTVLYIDIRGSKELANKHTRPVLAKIYRAYISEILAVLRGVNTIDEVFIEGDGIWAVYDTGTKDEVQDIFSTAAKVSSIVKILNTRFKAKGYSTIQIGIGIEDGKSLYMKAGYKGSGINEIVWIGKTIGAAAQLCGYGNKTSNDRQIMLSEQVYRNLSEHQKSLLTYSYTRGCYHGDVINRDIDDWKK